ncbi:L,D-transpeptidase catalytic domain [Roseivivax jejudonensis]|uniref:L,D-transpeptidase catalytic domain n=1 Tax=Roseivivax jejudonensis TaxID=1529041 RepID=A0A1X6ZQ66_9RHOB|nr:L,D-transpeptidase family protein [Roseivivax jejudonensis]SLN57710.1 L,D-transpeptidase catalytic domain [Roseivivax jejudonensis]
MHIIKVIAVVAAALSLSACGSKFRTYNGPEVTRVYVDKSERRMYLIHHDRVLKQYPIQLGFAPAGHKQFEGDGRTPEGHYLIDKRNPNSKFHLSVGISYPNENDIARALAMGRDPGGDIFIHGGPQRGSSANAKSDWTWGCIAVSDREMEHIYAMVRDNTPIYIAP